MLSTSRAFFLLMKIAPLIASPITTIRHTVPQGPR